MGMLSDAFAWLGETLTATDVAGLSDKFVNGQKEYACQHCYGPIAKGERHRAKTERNNEDKTIETFRFCRLCCAAMATYEACKCVESCKCLDAMDDRQELFRKP